MQQQVVTVTVNREIAEQIKRHVDTGSYEDASAVLDDALHLLEEQIKANYLRGLLAKARAQFDRGETHEWTPDFLEQLEQEVDEMERQGIEIEPDPDVFP